MTGVKYSDLPDLHILKTPDISVDDEGNMVWMNGIIPRDREHALDLIIDQLAEYINEWDHEHVEELMVNVNDLEDALKEPEYPRVIETIFDISALPSEQIPPGLETYPIWAMDKHGYCLVGAGQISIEPLADIWEWYVHKKPSYCTQETVEACYLCSPTNYRKDCMNNPVRYPIAEFVE